MTDRAAYDPFVVGEWPVAVKTVTWRDESRERSYPVDLYLPMAGLPTTGQTDQVGFSYPVVLFAHGWYGHRAECSIMCAHLCSHGYHVVCPDFPGSTQKDVAAALPLPHFNIELDWEAIARDRMADIPFLISAAASEFHEVLDSVGMVGPSLGGWTALMAPSLDIRVRAVVAMCPMGGNGPLAFKGVPALSQHLSFHRMESVSVTCLVADRDSWLPLHGQIDLFSRMPTRDKQLIVLRRADHLHFVDNAWEAHASFATFTHSLDAIPGAKGIPWRAMSELIPGVTTQTEKHARTIVSGVTTLQMDAGLKALRPAQAALSQVGRELRERQLDAYVLRSSSSMTCD